MAIKDLEWNPCKMGLNGSARLLILAVVFSAGSFLTYGQTRLAFIVGISHYQEGTHWPDINSFNDVQILRSALYCRQYKPENIIVLEDREATKMNIVDRFTQLTDFKVARGDQLFVHFSSHGQQRTDTNGDEVDGLDECIVPYDSPLFYLENKYEGEKLLSDDELQILLKKVRRKLGKEGHLFVSVDACHSGTSVRGYGSSARGTDIVMGPPGKSQAETKNADTYLGAREYSETKKQDDLADMCIFFGSSANQLNFEYVDKDGVSYGSLSYFLAKHLSQNSNIRSYRGLFEQVSYEMSLHVPRQQAEAEGNLDLTVLQGQSVNIGTDFKIVNILSDSTAVINGGIFHGILEGSVVSVSEDGSSDTQSSPLARVISSHANQSVIQFGSKFILSRAAQYAVRLKERNVLPGYSTFQVTGQDEKLVNKIRNILGAQAFLQSTSRNPSLSYSIKPLDAQRSICYFLNGQLQKIDSVVILNESQVNRAMDKLVRMTKNYLKAKYLKEIELTDSRMDVGFSIVKKPVRTAGKRPESKLQSRETMSTLKLGQAFQIKLHNFGTKAAYVSMINIQSDHKVNVLFPYGETSPLDFKIEPCQDLLIPVQYVAKDPKGIETLRLIASSKPVDFRSGFSTRSGSQDHPLSILLDDALFDSSLETRGVGISMTAGDEINIHTLQFKIVE